MKDRITELAKQAGFSEHTLHSAATPEQLQRFAELVRAEALEDAAKAVDELAEGATATRSQQFALDLASDLIRSLK